MKRLSSLLVLLLAATAQSGPKSNTYLSLNAQPRAAWFICDAQNAPEAVVVGKPDKANKVQVTRFDKKGAGKYRFQTYSLGEADGAAGHTYYALSLAGKEAGSIRVTNPGVLDHPELAFTDAITALELQGQELECRWELGTRFLGMNTRRTVLVTQTPEGQLVYQSFDFNNPTDKPSLEIRGGKSTGNGFVFENNGYAYSLRIASSRATLTVQQGAKTVSSQTFTAFTVAGPQ